LQEDARVDRKVLDVKGKVVLTLTSAGCNVLDALCEDAARVIAVDQNIAQTSLMELKRAGIMALSYNSFYEIFGNCNGAVFREVYATKLRPYLSDNAAQFWDQRQYYIDNFYYRGGSGIAAWVLVKILLPLLGLKPLIDGLLTCKSLEEQRAFYASYKERIHSAFSFLTFIGVWRYIAWLVAVPTNQQSLLSTNWNEYMCKCVDHLGENTWLAGENHYFAVYLLGKYPKGNTPRYLKKKWFTVLQQRINRVDIRCAPLFDVLKGLLKPLLSESDQKDGDTLPMRIDRFNLLDHMDWMEEQDVLKEWSYLTALAAPGALAIWKSISEKVSPQCLAHLVPPVGAVEKIQEFYKTDCTPTYRTVRCAHVPTVDEFILYPRVNPTIAQPTLYSDLQVLKQMMVVPFWRKAKRFFAGLSTSSKDSKEQMNAFYQDQAALYDGYRNRMLHGRSLLSQIMPVKSASVWVDVGGGTGFNLEYFANVLQSFKKVYVVDVCDPLLEQAKLRIAKNNWTNVELVNRDVCHQPILSPEQEKEVDCVSFSYSLTMIPDWKKAVDEAFALLKPGGFIAVTDFTVTREKTLLRPWFWQSVFKNDGVMLNPQHMEYLSSKFQVCTSEVYEGGFPYVPLLTCPYYVFIGKKPLSGSLAK
jgi:S-adenosylmethionine-diacylgycerolhomoserine-N-methlytransferase